MKTVKLFEQFVSEKEFFKGGLADGMTAQDLADKHGVSLEEIEAALDKGQKVEVEHTGDDQKALEIAKDHIFEDPKYYDKLAKIEGEPANESVRVETFRYKASHGKEPKGHGVWMFSYDKSGDEYFPVPNSMSYSDAVKWVKGKAKEDKKDYVYVMEGINDFSPLSYAKKVANKVMSLAAAAKEANMSQVELLKLVKRFDKNFKMYEADDHEVGMAQNQLEAILNAVMDLQEKIGEEEIDLPGWIQDHISQSYNYIKQANDGYHTLGESIEVNERLKVLLSPLMTKIMKNFSHKMDPALRAELNGAIQAAVAEVMQKNDIVVEADIQAKLF